MGRKADKPATEELPAIEMDLSSIFGLKKDYSDISIENYRTHLIFDDIDEFSARDACEFLIKSYFDDPKAPVTLIINSPGGVCDDGFAIIDLMNTLPMKVRTIALGKIMSMGFLIFVAGTKGERYLSPNSTLMCHQFSGVIGGKQFEVEAAMKSHKITEEHITAHLQKHTGLPRKKVKEILLPQHDVFLNALECVEIGVGDRLLDKSVFEAMSKDTEE